MGDHQEISFFPERSFTVQHGVFYGGADHVHPGIDLLGPGRPVLWGLTYRFVVQLLRLAGCAVPGAEDR